MADFRKVKRLKMNLTIIEPDENLTKTSEKFDLYKKKRSSSSTSGHPREPIEETQFVIENAADVQPQTYLERIHEENVAWESNRENIINAFFDTQAPRENEVCINSECSRPINLKQEHLRCKDCAAHAYFCNGKCAAAVHIEGQLPFHKPDVWKVMEQSYFELKREVYLRRPDHKCDNEQYTRPGIQVFDQKGRLHIVNIVVCKCEKDCVTFMRHSLWASSVETPYVAFHVDLLDWMEMLVLEGKVSLQTICQSIRWKNELEVSQFNTLYRGLVGESFEQFRHFKYKVRTMGTKDDVSCPACPKDSGSLFISLDGNFGLVRKKNSGMSTLEPKHGEKLFVADDRVLGTYVDGPDDAKVPKSMDCSNFQAGSNIRSKNKAVKLDVTGVFGSCCRHGVPHTFINMHKGEGLGYSLYVLDKLLDQVRGTEVKLHVLYDIACILEKHLKARSGSKRNLDNVSLAVPIFHVYGHKSSCHVNYSTRWIPGFGLTDGEEMERMWSFLRRFSFISKEMTPSHRIDLLTDGLLHYKRRKVSEIGLALVRNINKANSIRESTKADLEAAKRDLSIDIVQIDKWIEEEKEHYPLAKGMDEPFTKEERYVLLLQSSNSVRESLCQCDDLDTRNGLKEQLNRLNTEEVKQRKALKLKKRWQKTDPQFKIHKISGEKKKKEKILRQLHKQAMDYRFIQNLQRKYSDGQAIANRLIKNLQRASNCMKRSINDYNRNEFADQYGGLPDRISWNTICDPLAEVYERVGCSTESDAVNDQLPNMERQRLMDTRNLFRRSEEELSITKAEMVTVLLTLVQEHKNVKNVLETNIAKPDKQIGKILALKEKANQLKLRYLKCHSMFSRYINTGDIPNHLTHPLVSNIELSDDLSEEIAVIEMDEPEEELDEDTHI